VLSTPKSLRLQIGIFGRINVGKSSFLNMVSGQEVSITSTVPGTTTDIVEKTMELLPVGPVVFLDTAGFDDTTELGTARLEKTQKIFNRADIVVLVVEPNVWTSYEENIISETEKRKIPIIVVINKIDINYPDESFIQNIKKFTDKIILCSSEKVEKSKRDGYVDLLKKNILVLMANISGHPKFIIGDLIDKDDFVILVIPIDIEAPKGRIILPQVQVIRDVLDTNATAIIVKESEYKNALDNLKNPPSIVVCDSQVVDKIDRDTPNNIELTTFSTLFSRYKGDFDEMIKGAQTIKNLKKGDKVLIAEACSHHAMEDDIGRVKIPKWFKKYFGFDLEFDVCSGRDYPSEDKIKDYKLVVACGSCMITRRETLSRVDIARNQGVPITNYGLCISFLLGVLDRVVAPFIKRI